MTQWKSGICGCCSDCQTCCTACFCPCVVLTWNARTMQAKGVSLSCLDMCFGSPSKIDKPLVGGVVYGIGFSGLGGGVTGASMASAAGAIGSIHAAGLILHAGLRHEIRKRQNIPACCCPCCLNGFCEDLFCVTSCTSCALTQEKRELESMGIPTENMGLVNSMDPAKQLRVDTILNPPKPNRP